MLICTGGLTCESFAILDGQDRHVVLAPDLPTWEDNQPPQYRKSPRRPHRLLRLPDTNPCAVELQSGRGLPQINIDLSHPIPFIALHERDSVPVRAATWRIHWPKICRGTCACIGVSIHPNTLDSPIDRLLYWDLAQCSSHLANTPTHAFGPPDADFTMTLAVHWNSRRLLEAKLIYNFADLSPIAARTLSREVWLSCRDAPSLTVSPFISTAWGFAEVDMHFVGFLSHGVLELRTLCRWRILQQLMSVIQSEGYKEGEVWSRLEELLGRLPVPRTIRDQLRLSNFRKACEGAYGDR